MNALGNLKARQPLDKKIEQPKKAARRKTKIGLGRIVLQSVASENPFEQKT